MSDTDGGRVMPLRMGTNELHREAEEASSIAQDSIGLTPEERDLWEQGWLEGYRFAAQSATEEARND
jgi:hypothetical protein